MDVHSFLSDKGLLAKLSREYELLKHAGGEDRWGDSSTMAVSSVHRHGCWSYPCWCPDERKSQAQGLTQTVPCSTAGQVDFDAWIQQRLREAAAAKLMGPALQQAGQKQQQQQEEAVDAKRHAVAAAGVSGPGPAAATAAMRGHERQPLGPVALNLQQAPPNLRQVAARQQQQQLAFSFKPRYPAFSFFSNS